MVMSTTQLLEQFERLSPYHRKEAEDFIHFLAASERKQESLPPLTFSWAGSLSDLRGEFSSRSLKKKALDWMMRRDIN
jgi:hypothetical protein